ncbi:MAG: phosphomannomutase/phosphoglucomutase, partial [Gammaproteobacteria bacterium]
CGNGVAGELAPKLLTMLGVEVIPMYCEIDGTFPNHHPDPSKPENLVEVIDRVKQEGADLGLAFDGDGDRVGVVTTEGKVVFPDRLLILWAQDVLSRNPGGEIIYDVKCSTHVGKSVAAAGGKPTMWKTGHSFIKAKIKETGALLAGEMSGHVFFGERWYGFDDALYAAARLMEILGKDQRPATEVFNALPDSISTPELNLKMQEGETFAFIDKLVAKASFPDGRITDIDGMRVDWDDGWGLVRSSNTTPVLVFRFEADSDEALAQVQAAFREQIHAVDAELDLPF